MSSLQLPTFSPAPRKEGRHHSWSRHRRRQTSIRIIIGAAAIAVFYVIYITLAGPVGPDYSLERTDTEYESPSRTALEKDNVLEYEPRSTNFSTTSAIPLAKQTALPKETATIESLLGTSVKSSPARQAPNIIGKPAAQAYKTSKEEDEKFEEALQRVVTMLPDEMHVRELLRPVEGTGKEKLREMGLRARAFKRFFDAWEALHLVPIGDTFYVRDDVIQYLRSRENSRGDDGQSTLAQTVRTYESFRSLLQNLATLLFPWTSPYFADHMTLHAHFYHGGRGIVLTAGDDQASFLLTTINVFRKLGCTLPIEIMYLGDSDLGEDYRAELEQLPGVLTRDISQMVNDKGWQLKGWAGKPFAMLLSSFREVIFIDADALFFKNPEILFEDPGYLETGALFFHDRLMMAESKKRWLQQTLPKPISRQARQSRFWTGQSGHMQESGVVVVDKWKHFIPMLLVTRMNGPDRDGDKEKGIVGVYEMVYGDKETFWIGWELVGDQNYSFHKGPTGILGKISPRSEEYGEEIDDDEEEVETPASSSPTARISDKPKSQSTLLIDESEPPRSTFGLDPMVHIYKENVTMCSPQVLHMARDGSPLWFNGWILNNKFDKKHTTAGEFELYMKEPPEILEPEAWKLGEHNMCCLTGYRAFEFTEEEKKILKTIVDIAIEVGAYTPSGQRQEIDV